MENQIPIAGCQPVITCGAEVKMEVPLLISGTNHLIISNN